MKLLHLVPQNPIYSVMPEERISAAVFVIVDNILQDLAPENAGTEVIDQLKEVFKNIIGTPENAKSVSKFLEDLALDRYSADRFIQAPVIAKASILAAEEMGQFRDADFFTSAFFNETDKICATLPRHKVVRMGIYQDFGRSPWFLQSPHLLKRIVDWLAAAEETEKLKDLSNAILENCKPENFTGDPAQMPLLKLISCYGKFLAVPETNDEAWELVQYADSVKKQIAAHPQARSFQYAFAHFGMLRLVLNGDPDANHRPIAYTPHYVSRALQEIQGKANSTTIAKLASKAGRDQGGDAVARFAKTNDLAPVPIDKNARRITGTPSSPITPPF